MHRHPVCPESRRVCALLGGSGQPGPPVLRTVKLAALLQAPPTLGTAVTQRVRRDPLAA